METATKMSNSGEGGGDGNGDGNGNNGGGRAMVTRAKGNDRLIPEHKWGAIYRELA
jgi:hypothetical protein